MLVASIDIGVVNLGFALLNNNVIVFADKIQLHPKGRGKGKLKEYEIIEKVNKLFFQSEYTKYINMADIVLIENQMSRINLLIQYTIGTFLHEKKKNYRFIRPHDVKSQFNISTKSHSGNKRAAVKYASSIYPQFFKTLAADKQDDVDDAVLQALYLVEKTVINIKPRIKREREEKEEPKVVKKRKVLKTK